MNLSREHPFPGLRPFDFGDCEFFFGREKHTYALYRLLDRSRFVAVVGSSGSGKSSLVRAGLLPLLGEELDPAGGALWRWVAFHPGDAPMRALRDALVSLAAGTGLETDILTKDVETALGASSFGLSKAVAEIPGLSGRKLLLVVDQFEELFRYGGRRDEAINFVQRLLEATRSYSSTIQVLITMRSDFIGDCAQFQRLPEAVSRSQFLVPALDREEREEVILKPVELGEGHIEPFLVERLLNDGGAEMDQLPVLQHCMLRLWECATIVDGRRRLTEKDYDAIGGIAQALSQHADEVMEELGAPLGPAVEAVFRALSETDADGRATRRALSFARLLAESGVPEADLRRVVERFSADDCSFLVLSTPVLSDDTQVDVAHEALLRNWTKISAPLSVKDGHRESGWLAAEAEDGWEYRALLSLVKSGSAGATVTLPLDQVESRYEWWRSRTRTAAWAQRYGGGFDLVAKLFADSLAQLEKQRERERHEARAERDRLAQAEKARRDEEVRHVQQEFARLRARRTLIAAIAMALLALVALTSAAWAFRKDQELTQANAAAASLNQRLAADKSQLEREQNKLSSAKRVLVRNNLKLVAQHDQLVRQKDQLAKADAKVSAEKAKLAVANLALNVHMAELNDLAEFREVERTSSGVSTLNLAKTYVARYPKDPEIYVDLGALDMKNQKLADAKNDFNKAIAYSNAKDPWAYAALCDVASSMAYNARGQASKKRLLQSAVDDCNAALKLAPKMTYALRVLAFVEYLQSQLDGVRSEDKKHGLALAEKNVQSALSIDSYEEENWLYLCFVQFEEDDNAHAITSCKGSIRLYPDGTLSHAFLGRAELNSNDASDAIADFSAAIRLNDKYYLAYYWRARAEIDEGLANSEKSGQDFVKARNDLSFDLANDLAEYGADEPGYNAHYWRGFIEAYTSDSRDAVADLSAALRSNAGDNMARFWRGRAYIDSQNWQAAIADLSRTDIAATKYWLAYAQSHLGSRYGDALTNIEQYVSKNPTNGNGYLRLAIIELNAGDPISAVASANKARSVYQTSSDKSDAQAIVEEINAMTQHGLTARFVADSKAIAANPRDARAFVDRGEVYESLGNHVWAINDYSAAIAADPSGGYAFAARCRSEREEASDEGDREAAMADCDRALKADPTLAYALQQRALVEIDMLAGNPISNLTAASNDANRAVALSPHAADALSTRCYVYLELTQYQQAISDCSSAIASDPSPSQTYYWRALARFKTGAYAGGVADVQTYLNANPQSADGYLLQAVLQLALRNRAEARASAERALRYYKLANDQTGEQKAQNVLNEIGTANLQATQYQR